MLLPHMFTGLVQSKETITSIAFSPSGEFLLKLSKPSGWSKMDLGESIAIDGTCLTLVSHDGGQLEFHVGPETVAKTTLAQKKVGDVVNLERSLKLGEAMGGHWVTGHIDGKARITERHAEGESLWLQLEVEKDKARWVVHKGSVCLNGVSLTANATDPHLGRFVVCLIPETIARTNLADLKVGEELNIEFDHLVKTIDHLLQFKDKYNE